MPENERELPSPPPAFPDWLRRFDPLLAAEDTNALYQAFRLRRTVHARPTMAAHLRTLWSWDIASHGIVLNFILLVLALALSRFIGLLAIPALFVLLLFSYASFRVHRRRTPHLPLTVSQVFTRDGLHESAAREIWLAGFTGRDVLEAIYLEKREKPWNVLLGIWSLLLLVCLIVVTRDADIFSLGGFLFLGSFGFLAYSVGELTIASGIPIVRIYHLEPRLVLWQTQSALRATLSHSIRATANSLVTMIFLALQSIIAGILLFGYLDMIGAFPLDQSERIDLNIPAVYIGSSMIAVISLLLYLQHGVVVAQSMERHAVLLENAVHSFDRFIRTQLLEDPDA